MSADYIWISDSFWKWQEKLDQYSDHKIRRPRNSYNFNFCWLYESSRIRRSQNSYALLQGFESEF